MAQKIIQGTLLVTDTYIDSANATTNYGGAGQLYVGEANFGANVLRSLVKFDLSEIPSTATISSVILSLKISADYSDVTRTFRVYRVLRAWAEGEATWNVYTTGNSWATAGCSNTTTDREATDIGTASFSATEAVNTVKEFTLTASLVEEMLTGGVFTNNGFLIKADTETDDAYEFYPSEAVTSTNGPKLTVNYTYPGEFNAGIAFEI